MKDMWRGVGFWVTAGIPEGRRSNVYVECGCCEEYHRADFVGDCREDTERFPEPPPNARRVISIEEQMLAEEDD